MLREKRNSWHGRIHEKLRAIVLIPLWLAHSIGAALLQTSRSRTTTTLPRNENRDGIIERRSILHTVFNYPNAHTPLRPTAWLDGLRGVAAFEVLLYHWHLRIILFGSSNQAYGSQPDTKQWWRLPFIRNFFASGHTMVNVFFLISGFVLTQRSLGLIRSRNYDKLYPSVSSAIFRRAIRIYLPAVVISFVGMLLVYFDLKNDPPSKEYLYLQIIDWFYACRDYVNPFHNYYNGWEIVHRYEHTMWTLPLEFYGSMVCYLTIMAVAQITHPMKRTAVVLFITWFAVIKQNWWTANFLVGMLHADFMIWQGKTERSWSTSFPAKCCWFIVFGWALYVAGLPENPHGDYKLPGFDWYYNHIPESWKEVEGGSRFWWMISGCSMTIAISQLPLLQKIFETRICQYLGRISFMLYLVHVYLYELVGKIWREMLVDMVKHEDIYFKAAEKTVRVTRGSGVYISYFGFWIFMLPLVLAVAGQATRYVDDPSIRFTKWLEAKFIDD